MSASIDWKHAALMLEMFAVEGVVSDPGVRYGGREQARELRAAAKLCEAQIGKPTCWCGIEPPCTEKCNAHCRTCLCNKPEWRARLDAWSLVEELLAAIGTDGESPQLVRMFAAANALREALQP